MKFFQKNIDPKKDWSKIIFSGKKIIPGGTQLLSKRPEMFAPEMWRHIFQKLKVQEFGI